MLSELPTSKYADNQAIFDSFIRTARARGYSFVENQFERLLYLYLHRMLRLVGENGTNFSRSQVFVRFLNWLAVRLRGHAKQECEVFS